MCEPISIATGAMSAIGAVGQHQSASAAADAQNEASIRNYEHQLQVRENKHMQKLSAWANDRSVFSGKVQENFTAADKSYAAAQTVLNQEFDKAVVENQGAFAKLMKAQGQINTSVAGGQSKDRMGVMAMAALGRNQAIKSQSLTRAKEAFEAKGENIRDQQISANNQAYQKVALRPVEGVAPPQPVMQEGPSSLSLMAGIGNAVVGGFSSAQAANSLPNGQQLPTGGGFVPPSGGPAIQAPLQMPSWNNSLNMSTYAPFAS
jgi:hypothetical protein